MNIYLVSASAHRDWDTYDSFVIAAKDEETARDTHPDGNPMDWNKQKSPFGFGDSSWCDDRKDVTVELIGTASPNIKEGRVVCASFNAG